MSINKYKVLPVSNSKDHEWAVVQELNKTKNRIICEIPNCYLNAQEIAQLIANALSSWEEDSGLPIIMKLG